MDLLSPNITYLVVMLIGIIILILPFVFYLITAQKTLRLISPPNRKMQPGSVWLMLIPLFGYYWLFKIVEALSAGIRLELAGYGLPQNDTIKTTGLGWGIFLIAGLFFGFLYLIAYVAFVWHWLKVNEARKLILTMKEVAQQTDDTSIFR